MAMGYLFNISTSSEAAASIRFLEASQRPLGSFYNEHPNRGDLFSQTICGQDDIIDQTRSRYLTADGTQLELPSCRWMGRRATVDCGASFATLSLDVSHTYLI